MSNFLAFLRYIRNKLSYRFKKNFSFILKKNAFFLFFLVICLDIKLYSQENYKETYKNVTISEVIIGAERFEEYLHLLKNKNVGIVANHTSNIRGKHLVDTLIELGIRIKKIFMPEHGFRGIADAGEYIKSEKDEKTGISLISLYGEKRKPSNKDVKNLDVIIFDIQDVGVRFYTYISTMTYVMESCAENNIHFIVLDRPNPNGYYVDGPVLNKKYSSFIGLHPVPVVHGMTVGEYANMINQEGWLKNGIKCNLTVVPCKNYNHDMRYQLPERPSPNLPNMASVYLYPSLGFFEGTVISVGRGTEQPFQIFGHPLFPDTLYSFIPTSRPGSKTPPYLNQKCYGFNLAYYSHTVLKHSGKIDIYWLKKAYELYPEKEKFFNNYFNYLAGNSELKEQIINNVSEEEIRKSWEPQLQNFLQIRKKYLLYEDFKN